MNISMIENLLVVDAVEAKRILNSKQKEKQRTAKLQGISNDQSPLVPLELIIAIDQIDQKLVFHFVNGVVEEFKTICNEETMKLAESQ